MNDIKTHENQEPTQGFYIEASFDRLITKTKKDKDGREYLIYQIGVIVRTEESTNLYAIRTEKPDKWKNLKSQTPVKIRVIPRAFKDFLYFTIVE